MVVRKVGPACIDKAIKGPNRHALSVLLVPRQKIVGAQLTKIKDDAINAFNPYFKGIEKRMAPPARVDQLEFLPHPSLIGVLERRPFRRSWLLTMEVSLINIVHNL